MSEPTPEPVLDAFPEPPMTSAEIDNVETWEAPDQWPTADLSGLDDLEDGAQ